MNLTEVALAGALLTAWIPAGRPALAQTGATEPVRIGAILDMSSLYADVTGPGTEFAVRTAVADYGGKVLGRPVEVLIADHQTKADVAASIASRWFDTQN